MTQQPDANGPSRDDVPAGIPADVTAMLNRANRLGADPTVTNYGGGNTSCKVEVTHAATGEPATLLYVKGSGGDLRRDLGSVGLGHGRSPSRAGRITWHPFGAARRR